MSVCVVDSGHLMSILPVICHQLHISVYVCLPVCLSLCVCLSVCLSDYLSMSVCVVESGHLMSILPVICHQVQMTTYKLDISSIQSAAVSHVDNIIKVCSISLSSLLASYCCCCDSPAGRLLSSVVQVEEVCDHSRVVPHCKLRRMALTAEQMLYRVWFDRHLICRWWCGPCNCSKADSDQNANGWEWYGLTEAADFQEVRYGSQVGWGGIRKPVELRCHR